MEIYSRLVRVDKLGQDVEGDLAERWEVSPDGTVWTFYLRPDVKFSNGDPVTAEDVIYSFERAMGPDSANAWVFDGVEAVEMIDPQTIEITVGRPAAAFLNSMTLWGASIVSKEAVEGGDGPGDGAHWQRPIQPRIVATGRASHARQESALLGKG